MSLPAIVSREEWLAARTEPEWDDGCPSCSAGADKLSDGLFEYLRIRDTTMVTVSRAPLHKIEDYRRRRGWT